MIAFYRPGSLGGEMKCPRCGDNTKDAWRPLKTDIPSADLGARGGGEVSLRDLTREHLDAPKGRAVTFEWMRCEAEGCQELVVRMHEHWTIRRGASAEEFQTKTIIVRPPETGRPPLDVRVPPPFSDDYIEAAVLLAPSPRMSAVLSRRILYDLLETYAGIAEYTLNDSIKKFINDPERPGGIKKNLHYVREMGNFGAHTKKDGEDRIIPVTRKDAEWALGLIERLFDYFIITPAQDEELRSSWDRNREASRESTPPAGEAE
jgi:Domain of unknown function (DUF4145)